MDVCSSGRCIQGAILLDQPGEIRWKGSRELHRAACPGMKETQHPRVQRLTVYFGFLHLRGCVVTVSDNGVPAGLELNTDLILEPGDELNLQQAYPRHAFQETVSGDCQCSLFSCISCHHLSEPAGDETEIVSKFSFRGPHVTARQRPIAPTWTVRLELLDELGLGGPGLREQKNPGSVPVDAMDGSCLLMLPAEIGVQEIPCILLPGSLDGCRKQTRRLVEDQQVPVFV